MKSNGWNYRVLKTEIDSIVCYTLIEVYYDQNNQPSGWIESTKNTLVWDDYKDLKNTVSLMQLAFDKPIMVVENDKLKEII